jgi:L-rhamnose mutarotase
MKKENVTKRVGSLIKVRPEFEERYIILHKHAFPGVLDRIRKSNIRNYSIFLLDGMLFSYYEYIGNDYDADMKAIADPTTKDWWKLTDPMQEPLPTRKEGEWWAVMDQFSLIEDIAKPYTKVKRYAYVVEIKPGTEDTVKNLLASMKKLCTPLLKKFHFQNDNIYFKDNKLYAYVEYTGSDFVKDDHDFYSIPEVKKWNDDFKNNFLTGWKEMKEVFHTN